MNWGEMNWQERAEKAEAELAGLKSAPVRGMNEEMLERVDQEARRRYRKFMSSARGTTITASDSFESWLVWVSWEFAMNECHSDHYSMLGRIAELEAELAKLREQNERAEAQATELKFVIDEYRHENDRLSAIIKDAQEQKPYAYAVPDDNQMPTRVVKMTPWETLENLPLYAAPVPAVAVPAVPEDVIEDHRRLVRELDVLINGEDGAAAQASLCDIVAQVAKEGLVSGRKMPAVPENKK